MTIKQLLFVLHPEHKDLKRGELPEGFKPMPMPFKAPHRGWLILIALCSIYVTVIVGPQSLETIRSLIRFLQDGREITATVDSCRTVPMTRRSDYADITYSYTVDGVLYQHKTHFGGDCIDYPPGHEFKGFYLPYEPTPMKFGLRSDLTVQLVMHVCLLLGYGSVSPLIILYCISQGVFRRRDIRNVAREGRITRIYREKEDLFVVEYRFKPSPKTSIKGRDAARRPDLLGIPLPESGTPVTVLYTDRNQHRLM